jgi:curli biogenesis system outer membrane secretion channel CsgG
MNPARLAVIGMLVFVGGCATVESPPVATRVATAAPPAPIAFPSPAQPSSASKHKIAIGRFSNATNYGRALLAPGENDPLATQAADMLAERLTDSGQFTVLERGDLGDIAREQSLNGQAGAKVIGADVLIVGSVTQFGRKVEGQHGFMSSTKRQVATATVEVRLVDVRTGVAFFATRGTGSASVEAGEVAGFGNAAGYDSTLNDKAIDAAISDLINNVIQRLDAHT